MKKVRIYAIALVLLMNACLAATITVAARLNNKVDISISLPNDQTYEIKLPGIPQYLDDLESIISDDVVIANYSIIEENTDPFAYVIAYNNNTKEIYMITKYKEEGNSSLVLHPLYKADGKSIIKYGKNKPA